MGSEVQLTYGVSTTKDAYRWNEPTVTRKIDLVDSAGKKVSESQEIGTTEEVLDMGSGNVDDYGLAEFVNLDSTNYVEIGVVENAVFRGLIKLYPKMGCPVWLSTTTLYAKANGSPVRLQFTIQQR